MIYTALVITFSVVYFAMWIVAALYWKHDISQLFIILSLGYGVANFITLSLLYFSPIATPLTALWVMIWSALSLISLYFVITRKTPSN